MDCWKKRTKSEKRLIVVAVVFLVLVILFLICFVQCIVKYGNPKASQERSGSTMLQEVNVANGNEVKICNSPECIHTASKILQNMDKKFDPCDNIYDFACGSFLKNTRIPDEEATVDSFSIITNQLYEQIQTLLDDTSKPGEIQPFVLAKSLYQACVNTTAIEARGEQPLLDMLRRLGGWPILDGDAWDDTTFSWETSVYKFRSAGYPLNYLFEFNVDSDYKNSKKRVVYLDQASLMLSREYLNRGISDKLVQSYYDYMVDIAVLLGADRTRAKTELQESLQFGIKLANISLPLEKRRNATSLYNPMTIRELQQQFPSIPWLDYINRLLAPHVQVGLDEVTVVNVPKYIKALELLLENTPKRTLANYVMWRVVDGSVSCLTDNLRRRQLAYSAVLSGVMERKSRWKECADTVKVTMPIAVGALYIKRYFDENSKSNALEMVKDIRQQFRKILTEADWMDDDTRKSALEKADAMSHHIAYPSEMLDDKKLTEYYQALQISSDKLLESMLNINLFDTDNRFRKLREPVNKTDWTSISHPTIVNALYSRTQNSIQFPAGILQGTFFSAERPAYMNYGAIGYIIGHEITHGFDDQGCKFDKNGNLNDWWHEVTKQKYLAKAKCIIDQYSNYTVAEVGMEVNGVLTQGENIADNGGIREAYYGYQAWIHRHGEEARLPGLEEYTPKQMFWLSAANSRCVVFRNEVNKQRMATDVHAPGRFRVVGPLSNMDEFASDFKCPAGSYMNPNHKCKVW